MNAAAPSTAIRLQTIKHESLVDSRIMAAHLGNQHKHTLKLIRCYQSQLETLGVMRFQNSKPIKGSKGGRPETYALLNEDQCYLVLTLCTNTEQAVALKLKLVKAFKAMRESLAAKVDYLPCYRVEKMINKTLGIPSGERKHLPPHLRTAVSMAERLAGSHYLKAIGAGSDHKHAYNSAKCAVAIYADSVREALPMPESRQ